MTDHIKILEKNKKIDVIYHISDVHVMKNNTRDKEYEEVFNELCKSIKIKNDNKNGIFCVTGDIFDNGLSPSSVVLVKKLFIDLAEMMDIVVIRGNHDGSSRSNTVETFDFLFPILYKLETKHKIHYLNGSGIYEYGNLLFGYTDYFENQVFTIDKKYPGKTKIGLWHGTIHGSNTDCNNVPLEGKFNAEAFKCYDYVLLGDIHKYQFFNLGKDKKNRMWYPGSTLQLNYGENISGHGYVTLDLKTKEAKLIPVKNNYGFLTVTVKKNKAVKYDEKEVPYNINLRIIYEDTDEDVVDLLYDKIKKKHNVMSYSKTKKEYFIDYLNEKKEDDEKEEELKDNETSVKRLVDYIKKNNEKTSDEEISEMEKIIKEKIKEVDYKYDTTVRNIKLKNIIFNNFNIYNENNCVDFENFKGIVNLSGANGTGKSSIIHALIFGLYGICEHAMTGKFDYVNSDKLKMEILISMSVNEKEYKIYRSYFYKGRKKNLKNFKNNVILYENGVDISGKNIPTINNQIIEIFGTQESFVRMCIMEQKVRRSFIDYNDNEKTDYICKILKLDLYNKICESLESDVKSLKRDMKKNEGSIYGTSDENEGGDLEITKKKKLNELEKKNKENKESEKDKKDEYDLINREKIGIEMKLEELKDFDNSKKFEKLDTELKSKIKKIIMEKIELEKSMKQKKKDIETQEKELEKYEDMEEKNKKFQKEKKENIKNINKEINDLMVQIVELDKKNDNIDKIKKEKENMEKDNVKIKKDIEELESQIEEIKSEIKEYESDKKNSKKYEKYVELKEELEKINESKKKKEDKLNDVMEKIKELDIEHQKHQNDHKESEKTMKEMKKEIEKKVYKNIEHEKEKFDEKISNQKKEINNEIQEDLKNYVNIKGKVNVKEIESDIHKLEREYQKFEKEIKEREKEYDNKKEEIVDLSKKYDKKLDSNYEKYVKLQKEVNEKTTELSKLEGKLEDLNNHYEMVKNHEYNEKCKVCMKNKLTVDLLNTKKNIESCEEEIDEIKTLITEKEKSTEKQKKYFDLYNEREQDKINNDKLNHEIEKEEKNILLVKEKQKGKKNEIDELKRKVDEYKNNKVFDERISNNRKKLGELENEKFPLYDTYSEAVKKMKKEQENMELLEIKMREYNNMNEHAEKIKRKTKEYDDEIDELNEKFEKYEKYGLLFDTYQNNKTKLDEQNKELEMLNNKQNSNIANISLYEHKIDDHNKYFELNEKNKVIKKEVEEKREQLKEYEEETNEKYERYIETKENKNELQMKISDLTVKLNNIYAEEKECTENISNNDKNMEKVNLRLKVKQEFTDVKQKYDDINEEIEKIRNDNILMLKQLTELEVDIKNIQKIKSENKTMKKEHDIKNNISYIIRNGYVDNLLSNEIIPKFCDGVNSILSSFVNYKIHMVYDNKKIFLYKKDTKGLLSNAVQLSGYESLMLEISLRMYINSKNRLQKINFFVIDEGFSFCDDSSIQKIPNLFDYMRKLYDFTIVVSHNETIKLYTDVNLPISRNNGVSKVYIVSEKNKTKIEDNFKLINKINSKNPDQVEDDSDHKETKDEPEEEKSNKKGGAKKAVKKVTTKVVKKITSTVDYKEKNKLNKEQEVKKNKAKKMLEQSLDSDSD
jgi:DNA repair exonuclease SbcCD ATPase subunit/DNA repair exonuclease SbcCD nuclease subunit